jgi:gluconolactonase
MSAVRRRLVAASALLGLLGGPAVWAGDDAMTATPKAVVDLATREGTTLLNAQWRYSDTRIIQVAFHDPGMDGQPTGRDNMTYDYLPKAGAASFDDSGWERIDPTTLSKPRGHGRLAFNWYRIRLTIPDRIGDLDPTGSTLVFETQVDDYAEIWVDGELPHPTGQSGGRW